MAKPALKSERLRVRNVRRVISTQHDRVLSTNLPPSLELIPADRRCNRCGGFGVTLYSGDGFAQQHAEWHCINCGHRLGWPAT